MAAPLALGTDMPAIAAQQGNIGETSSASIGISVSVAPRMALLGATDSAIPGDPGLATRRICVSANSATGGYSLAGTGSGERGSFALASADGTSLPLALGWSDGAGDPIALEPAGPVSAIAAANGCAALTFSTPAASDGAAYAGAVTLVLAPL